MFFCSQLHKEELRVAKESTRREEFVTTHTEGFMKQVVKVFLSILEATYQSPIYLVSFQIQQYLSSWDIL
jgi:hypothetical protein